MFFDAPICPELSLSTDPEHCDFLELDLDARTVQIRLSGMETPVVAYCETVERIAASLDDLPRYLFAGLTGYYSDASPDPIPAMRDMVRSGARSIRHELPRGTLHGGGLDDLAGVLPGDPVDWSLMHPKTLGEYLRLNGMRRNREELELEWDLIGTCRASGIRANVAPYPALVAPGAGGFLS